MAAFDRGLAGRIEERAQRLVELAVPHHDHLDGDPVVRLHLALQQPDALGQHGGVLADGAGRPALEQPGPQLALLGPGQAHDVLGVVGRALDERQRLQHRVVDVGRHLRPLLGQRARLALGDQVADQAQPPRAEDDARLAATTSAAPPTGRSAATVVWPMTSSDDAARPDEHADHDAGDEPAAALPVGVGAEERDDVVVDERLLRLVGVAPDEDDDAERPGRSATR